MDANKMRDISREQFEAVFSEKYPLIFAAAKSGDSKAHGDMSIAWWGWQASREAVVVHMPNRASDAYREHFDDVEGGSFHEAAYISDVRKAIEAQGLKVAL